MNKYFSVTAKCGHVGKRYYIPIDFAIRAESAQKAAQFARQLPRVKHDHKDAIQRVRRISYEDYLLLREQNDCDPYLKCKNVQEQRLIGTIYDRIVEEEREEKEQIRKEKTDTHYYIGKSVIRNVKSFLKNQPDYTRFSTVRDDTYAA